MGLFERTLDRPVKSSPGNNSANGHQALERKPRYTALNRSTLGHLTVSLKRRWKRYRKGLKRCQERFSEGAVHESRVETRRLLSLLELLRPFLRRGQVNRAQTALKEHLDTFDDLRDTQVQLLAIRKMRRLFPAAGPFLDYLTKREERFRRETRSNIKRIRTRRLGKCVASFREEMKSWRARASTEEVNAMLLQSVDGAFARAVDLRKRILPGDTETIHRTRVAFKKLRYMIEILADYLPAADEKLLVAMHRYQTMMGDIQDAEVVLRTFDKFLLKKPVNLAAARRLRRELLCRRQWLIRVYLGAADQLFEFWHGAGKESGHRETARTADEPGAIQAPPRRSRARVSRPKAQP
jgi:CHAD domain-containing protein